MFTLLLPLLIPAGLCIWALLQVLAWVTETKQQNEKE
jgi:hypothetical protein